VACVALAALIAAPAARSLAADPPALPVEAPVLDKEKGARAVAAYRKALRGLCAQLRSKRGGDPEARLRTLGLEGVDAEQLCADAGKAATSFASGALLESGRDEVLLDVFTGRSAQTGASLAVMRDDGKGYRLVRHILDAARFEARLRLVTPGRRDILFICEYRGLGGLYPGDCGFLGSRGLGEGVALLDAGLACGEFSSISVGKTAVRGDRLTVELVLREMVRKPGRNRPDGDCRIEEERVRRSFDIDYKFDGKTFRRVTPTPRAVQDVLDKG